MRSLKKNPHPLYYLLGTALLGALALAIFEANTYYMRNRVLESVYGASPHRVPCDKLPTPDEVRRVLSEHSQVVSEIKSINPGFTVVEINTMKCPGKADILILYASASDREAIKAILGDGKYLYGVPYDMKNI